MSGSGDDFISLPDGSVLVMRGDCACGQSVTTFRGITWNDDDTPHDCDDFKEGS